MLAATDGARRGGVFCGNPAVGRIPHGQAAAAELLAECYGGRVDGPWQGGGEEGRGASLVRPLPLGQAWWRAC